MFMRGRLGIAFALLLAALPWHGAHAHAVLLESSPAADAVLEDAPERIVLRFNEPVGPAVIRLLQAAEEASIELGGVEVIDTELSAPLPPGPTAAMC
jgi:copper transport protein